MWQGKNDTYDFEQIRNAEYDAVVERREAKSGRGPARKVGDVPENLFGVGLSGGGIRSSSFCLGVLQALHTQGLISRLDYLSTVSGGGHIGASMVAAMSRGTEHGQFPFADAPKKTPNQAVPPDSDEASSDDVRDSEPVSHIRDNSRYLIPNGMSDKRCALKNGLSETAASLSQPDEHGSQLDTRESRSAQAHDCQPGSFEIEGVGGYEPFKAHNVGSASLRLLDRG